MHKKYADDSGEGEMSADQYAAKVYTIKLMI